MHKAVQLWCVFLRKAFDQDSTYKKIIVFGVSGEEKKHRITPVYIDETEFYRELPDVESFISFNEDIKLLSFECCWELPLK